MFRWSKAKPKKKKTAHVRKEPPKPYTPPDIPKFTKQSEKAKPKEEKRVSPEKAFMDTFRQLTSCHRSIDIWETRRTIQRIRSVMGADYGFPV